MDSGGRGRGRVRGRAQLRGSGRGTLSALVDVLDSGLGRFGVWARHWPAHALETTQLVLQVAYSRLTHSELDANVV